MQRTFTTIYITACLAAVFFCFAGCCLGKSHIHQGGIGYYSQVSGNAPVVDVTNAAPFKVTLMHVSNKMLDVPVQVKFMSLNQQGGVQFYVMFMRPGKQDAFVSMDSVINDYQISFSLHRNCDSMDHDKTYFLK